MQTLKLSLPLFSIEITGETERDLIRQAAFWLSIPHKCPVCSKPIVLDYATPKTYIYFKLKCTGETPHTVNLGEPVDKNKSLYYDTTKTWEKFRPGRHEDDQASASGPLTPDPASRSSSAGENVGTRRNSLIHLINKCKGDGINCGLNPSDVGAMDENTLDTETTRLTALVNKGAAR